MKLFDLKIGIKDRVSNTHWRTIGTVFAADDARIVGANGKPCGFAIDYPTTNGIIVPRQDKKSPSNPDAAQQNGPTDDIPF